jgi:hypothetical protein
LTGLVGLLDPHVQTQRLIVLYVLSAVVIATKRGTGLATVTGMLSVVAFSYFSLRQARALRLPASPARGAAPRRSRPDPRPAGGAPEEMFAFTDEARTLADALWPRDLALRLPWCDPEYEARYQFVGSPALVTREDGILGQLAATAGIQVAATSDSTPGISAGHRYRPSIPVTARR